MSDLPSRQLIPANKVGNSRRRKQDALAVNKPSSASFNCHYKKENYMPEWNSDISEYSISSNKWVTETEKCLVDTAVKNLEDEKPVLWLAKKKLQMFPWAQKGAGFKALTVVFTCVKSAEELRERKERAIQKRRWKQRANLYTEMFRKEN